jgi:hypothetical protein
MLGPGSESCKILQLSDPGPFLFTAHNLRKLQNFAVFANCGIAAEVPMFDPKFLMPTLTAVRRDAAKAEARDDARRRNRMRLAIKDDSLLRTKAVGYDWTNPDPDQIMVAARPDQKVKL